MVSIAYNRPRRRRKPAARPRGVGGVGDAIRRRKKRPAARLTPGAKRAVQRVGSRGGRTARKVSKLTPRTRKQLNRGAAAVRKARGRATVSGGRRPRGTAGGTKRGWGANTAIERARSSRPARGAAAKRRTLGWRKGKRITQRGYNRWDPADRNRMKREGAVARGNRNFGYKRPKSKKKPSRAYAGTMGSLPRPRPKTTTTRRRRLRGPQRMVNRRR